MKSLNLLLALPIIFLSLTLSSCKKCVVEGDDVNDGSIVQGVIVYPESGYMTANMGGNYVIRGNHPYADRFEVSINGGAKTSINYSSYTLLCFPTSATCNANYARTVTVNHAAQTVVYKIVVTQCKNCKETRSVENYVLIPAIPASYVVTYDVTYVDK